MSVSGKCSKTHKLLKKKAHFIFKKCVTFRGQSEESVQVTEALTLSQSAGGVCTDPKQTHGCTHHIVRTVPNHFSNIVDT